MSQLVQIAYTWICSLFKQLKISTLKAGFTSISISYLAMNPQVRTLMFRNPSHPVSNISCRVTFHHISTEPVRDQAKRTISWLLLDVETATKTQSLVKKNFETTQGHDRTMTVSYIYAPSVLYQALSRKPQMSGS